MRAITGMGALLLVLLALVACAPSSPARDTAVATPTAAVTQGSAPRGLLPDVSRNADGYFDITVEQLAKASEEHNFTLVNVHIPYEGELPATDLLIPFDTIADQTDQLPAKDAPIVLYCRSGSMSTQAAQRLVELDGGFNAWQAAGYELLQKE